MQEEQTVSFSPMYVEGPVPWFTRLFALYILVVVVIFLVRVIKLLVGLRNLRRAQKHPNPAAAGDSLWAECYSKANSFKEISTLTFYASFLNATWLSANVLLSARAEKEANPGYVLARAGDGLFYLALGLIVCTALYSAALLFQAALRRRDPHVSLARGDRREPDSVPSS